MPSQFGQLFEAIVGGVSQLIMAGATTAQALTTKNYVQSIQKTQQQSAQQALLTEQQNIAFQEQAGKTGLQIGVLKNLTMEQITKIVVFTGISVTVFGILIYYYVTVWRDDV